MSVPGFASVMPFYLSDCEKRVAFNTCMCLVFPILCPSTYRKVKGVVLTYVCTWFSLRHMFLVKAW